MQCLEAKEHVHARLDGELDDSGTSELGAHLEGCPECRAFSEEMDSLRSWIVEVGETDRMEPTAGTVQRSPSSRWWRGVPALAASFLLGLGLILTSVLRPVGPPSPPPVAATFEVQAANENLLVVQLESQNPGIHIVWLYPKSPAEGVSQ